MKDNPQTVEDLVARIRHAGLDEFDALERTLAADTRVTVQRALQAARKRIDQERAEQERVRELYRYQEELAGGRLLVGLDEVGRGPLAGPLTVGAVVLRNNDPIAGLNDSKQVAEQKRAAIANEIRTKALAYSVVHISPQDIDTYGMSASLRRAFSSAVADIDNKLPGVEVILLDGNPLHLDDREINVVKGDARCASIAAASLLAKVERDALMVSYDEEYPDYGFASHKGYASAQHQDAIRTHGLTPLHRVSFCGAFLQDTLF